MYKSVARQINDGLVDYVKECNQTILANYADSETAPALLDFSISNYSYGGHTTFHGTLYGYCFVISVDDDKHIVVSVSDGAEWQEIGQILYGICTTVAGKEVFANVDIVVPARRYYLSEALITQIAALLGKKAIYAADMRMHMMEWHTADSEVWQMEEIPKSLPKPLDLTLVSIT